MMDYVDGFKAALSGVGVTLQITSVAVIIGIVVGVLVAMMRISQKKPLRIIASVYVDLLRGTPLLVQACLLYFGVPSLIQANGGDFTWSTPLIASFIVCGINSSAYVSEIVRSGLQAIDKGQMEAARSLGMTYGQTMRYIIIPQAFRIIIPALGNEFVTLIKETAVLSVITVTDITRKSMLYSATTFKAFEAYTGTALVYLMLTITLSKFMNYVERRLSNDVRS